MAIANVLREGRKRLYGILSGNADLQALATGGIFPASSSYTSGDRLAQGPHVFYYTQGYARDGFRRVRHRMVIESVVPAGTFVLNGTEVDAAEYAEAMHSAVVEAIGGLRTGDGLQVIDLVGAQILGDGFFVWQTIVEVVVPY